jgi:hypothetical protein
MKHSKHLMILVVLMLSAVLVGVVYYVYLASLEVSLQEEG